jgi:hypothetical protein
MKNPTTVTTNSQVIVGVMEQEGSVFTDRVPAAPEDDFNEPLPPRSCAIDGEECESCQ